MSELIQKADNRATIRWKLLTGASALALTLYVSSPAKAEDTHPLIWLDLGGQAEMVQGLNSPFTADFMNTTPDPDSYTKDIFSNNQRPPRFVFGFDGKVSFQPEDSNWVFSAGIRYGRGHASRHEHRQGAEPLAYETGLGGTYTKVLYPIFAAPLADVQGRMDESHAIVDFSAGKDVGLGGLGHNIDSSISAGVRFAQFKASSGVAISARPHIGYVHLTAIVGFHIPWPTFYQYFLTGETERSFKGVGPSLSWTASAPLAGNAEHGELSLDWGINGAVLFGRQSAKVSHTTEAYYLSQRHCIRTRRGVCNRYRPTYVPIPSKSGSNSDMRSRRVTVPNIGGFVALTARYGDAKVSIGYRIDSFLNAMDTGIDARKNSNLTFNGPYASISIGLGD